MGSVQIDDGALNAFLDDIVPQDIERRAFNVENKAKRLVASSGGGRLYTTRFWRDREGRLRRGGARPPHRASAPGSPPASDTGRLLASIHHEMVGAGQNIEAHIGTDVFYAIYLELGTRYMAPRPFLRPALGAAGDDTGLLNSGGEEYF